MSTFHCKFCHRPIFRKADIVDRRMIWDLKDYQAECYMIKAAIELETLRRYDCSLHEGWYCCRFIMMRMTHDKFGTGRHLLVYTDSVIEVPEGGTLPAKKGTSHGILSLTSRDYDEVIKRGEREDLHDTLMVVKFGAIWCPPCRLMDAVFERIQTAGDLPKVQIFDIDIDQEQELASRWNFQSIPFTLFFMGGRQVDLAQFGYPAVDGGLIGGLSEASFRGLCQAIQSHVHA